MSLRIALTHLYAWPEVRRGGERYLHELAGALAAAGHRVTILTSSPTPHRTRILDVDVRYVRRTRSRIADRIFPPLPPESSDGAPVHVSDEVVFGAKAFARLGIAKLDVWHALGTADAAAAATLGRLRNIRSVYTDLGIPDRVYREARSDARLYDVVVRHIDRYVCLSKHALDGLRRDFGRDGFALGGGADLEKFTPGAHRSDAPSILFTSSATENRKNLPLLLEAAARVRSKLPELEVWVASPTDAARVVEAAPPAARDAVVLHAAPAVDDLIDLYRRAWVTALPSHHEAFGLVVVESLACGTPVVTLADGAPAELVTDSTGATAAADAGSLADACIRALELAREATTVEACRAAAEPHDWQRGVVPRMEAIYGGMAS